MSFADDIAVMQAAVYARNGVDAVYTPAGGTPDTVRVLFDTPDTALDYQGLGRKVTAIRVVRVRVSEFATKFPGVPPARGDALAIAGDSFVVAAKPEKKDPRATEWTLDLGAAS